MYYCYREQKQAFATHRKIFVTLLLWILWAERPIFLPITRLITVGKSAVCLPAVVIDTIDAPLRGWKLHTCRSRTAAQS